MTVTLKPINEDNFSECIHLRVKDSQKTFVAPNLYSIAQSKIYPDTHMRGIYSDETLAGFVMWKMETDADPPEMWIWRFMVAGEHQRNGYGRAAMGQVIALLKIEGVQEVFLSYLPENKGGAQFYASLGFEHTGRIDDSEIVVKLNLTEGN